MENKQILEVIDLKVSFLDPSDSSRVIEAVRGVTLEVGQGTFTSLVGESGSGKSVTSLSLTQLVQPHRLSGKILWRGEESARDILSLNAAELLKICGRQIAYVFQDPGSSLNPVLRVGRQIAETYRAHFGGDEKTSKKQALDRLDDVQMKDAERVYESYPHELSGGMRQRAMIAMALIAQPQLLVADEPTTALDSAVEKEILNLLAKVQKERGLSILFITHDIAHASFYSDKIYVMKHGLIEEKLERAGGQFIPHTDYAKKLFTASFWDVPVKSILQV